MAQIYFKDSAGNVRAYDDEAAYLEFGNPAWYRFNSYEEMAAYREQNRIAKMTRAQKVADIESRIEAIVASEGSKPLYFYGFGFVKGMVSINQHYSHPDSEMLVAWRSECCNWFYERLQEIDAGTLDIDDVMSSDYLTNNLPSVQSVKDKIGWVSSVKGQATDAGASATG
jgi:hypothetical protein